MGSYEIQHCKSMPRETESNLQAWNSDPECFRSRTWPEEIEQSVDLRVDGITQQRNLHGRAVHAKNRRNKSKKLVTAKRNL